MNATLEDRLRASQSYNRSIIESCAAALIVVDPALRITDVNAETVRLTGCPRGDLIGSPMAVRFSVPDDMARQANQTLDTGTLAEFDIGLPTDVSGGRRMPVRFSRFEDPFGQPRGLLVVLGRDPPAHPTAPTPPDPSTP